VHAVDATPALVFTGQAAQEDAPLRGVRGPAVSTGQLMQTPKVESQYWPGTHATQKEALGREKELAGQELHTAAPTVADVLAGQEAQDVASSRKRALAVPAAQGSQAAKVALR
jgi:hypothetical protein